MDENAFWQVLRQNYHVNYNLYFCQVLRQNYHVNYNLYFPMKIKGITGINIFIHAAENSFGTSVSHQFYPSQNPITQSKKLIL